MPQTPALTRLFLNSDRFPAKGLVFGCVEPSGRSGISSVEHMVERLNSLVAILASKPPAGMCAGTHPQNGAVLARSHEFYNYIPHSTA